ncbi:tumor necrosis factor receptor superfamily member 5 isoform 3-T3 [Molossus nigricans]
MVHPEPPNVCSEKQYLIESQCCNLCPPGHRMVNDCTKITDTECSPCSRGEFLDSWNRETRCHPHRYCDPNQGLLVLSEGTSETDTICICDEGQHCVNEACEMCSPHSPCSAGFGVKKNATRVSDTICEPCLVGFFSNVSSAYEECQPWTSCEIKGLVELQAGTKKTDAVCDFPRHRMRPLVVIPIVVAILFAIVLVSACISESPGKVPKAADNRAFYQKDERQDPVEDSEELAGHSTAAPVQETLHWCQPVTQEDGKESRISVQERQ